MMGAGQIGTVPMWSRAPLEYRTALDAALSLVTGPAAPVVHCQVPELAAEASQRLPNAAEIDSAQTILWIEPLAVNWQDQLERLLEQLDRGGLLVILASRGPARWLPERQGWPEQPLGLQIGGLGRLRRSLRQNGLSLERELGFHTGRSVIGSLLGKVVDRLGYPDLGDRLAAAARLYYASSGPWAAVSTVVLLVAHREGA
jgi:hypothetical protein